MNKPVFNLMDSGLAVQKMTIPPKSKEKIEFDMAIDHHVSSERTFNELDAYAEERLCALYNNSLNEVSRGDYLESISYEQARDIALHVSQGNYQKVGDLLGSIITAYHKESVEEIYDQALALRFEGEQDENKINIALDNTERARDVRKELA